MSKTAVGTVYTDFITYPRAKTNVIYFVPAKGIDICEDPCPNDQEETILVPKFSICTEQELHVVLLNTNKQSENCTKFPDYTDKLHSITTVNASWTATDNCVVTGWLDNYQTTDAKVYVDGAEVGYGANSTCSIWILVKKGQTVTTRTDGGRYNLGCYRLMIN